MPLLPSILLLCVSPIVITVTIGVALKVIATFRRGFHAHRTLPTSAIFAAIGVLLLHSGFFLAPLLLFENHIHAALWLVMPISVVGSLGLLWILILTAGASDKLKRVSLVVAGMLAAYAMPVVVLAMHAK